MPYRMVNLAKAGQKIGDLFAIGSFSAAVTGQNVTSAVLAITAVGTVSVPRLIDWYRQSKAARREERSKDLDQQRRDILKERDELDQYYLDRAMGIARLQLKINDNALKLEQDNARLREQESRVKELEARIAELTVAPPGPTLIREASIIAETVTVHPAAEPGTNP